LGVDIYDPTTGTSSQSGADNLPAWLLDEDYDGFSFNVCQVFFPDGATRQDPWDKLENALRGTVDAERMEFFRGTASIPFEKGLHEAVAVKVIDQRGNESIKVIKLQAK
jgi:adenine-specific DNA-methyltransferase